MATVRVSEKNRPFIRVEAARSPPRTTRRMLVGHATYSQSGVAAITSGVAGRVASVAVRPGDQVQRGQELARIKSADLAAAEAALATAGGALDLAERNAARAELLFKQGAGTDADRQTAEAARRAARIEKDRAAVALRALGDGEGVTGVYVLRSLIDGTVTETSVAVGASVTTDPSDTLFVVANLDRIWILADVRPRDHAFVQRGDSVLVQLTSVPSPGRVLRGTIADVGEVVSPATQAASARIELHVPRREIRPGMFVQILLLSPETGVALIPKTSVIADRDRFFVYVQVGQGTFARREVTLGDEQGDNVVVQSGVCPGDAIVVRGAILLEAEANSIL